MLKQFRFEKIKNETVRAVCINIIAILVALATSRKNFEFFKCAVRFISQLPDSVNWSEKLFIGKNIFKNIGINEIARLRMSPDQFVLLGEGPQHTAQVLFVRLTRGKKGSRCWLLS